MPGRMHTVELGFSCLSSYVPRYVQCLPVNQGQFCLARMPIVAATVVVGEVPYRPSRCKCQPNSRQPGTILSCSVVSRESKSLDAIHRSASSSTH